MVQFKPPSDFHTAILFTVFNRPGASKAVFESIRAAKPPRLYIAADGPRRDVVSDVESCAKTREIVNAVDWPCEIRTLFRDQNLGCGVALSSALTWFFSQEDEGIILEDDCLPSQSFFWYCQELLEQYRHDTRIMHIGGNNFQNGWRFDAHSYYFSAFGHVWGWATWSRAWRGYDFKIKDFLEVKRQGYFDYFFLNPLEKLYRLRKLDQVYHGTIDTWDYQWDFARYMNSGLAIVPAINLVKNIGYGGDATHTKNSDKDQNLEALEMSFPLSHPPFVLRGFEADKRYCTHFLKERIVSKLKLGDVFQLTN